MTTPKNVFNLAAIDIGSNAARILIKRVEISATHEVHTQKIQFLRIPIRLGFDVFTQGNIGKEREYMLTKTMKIFRHLLKLYNVEEYQIVATAALRDAKNGKRILRKIRKKTKMDIRIISGDEEAQITLDNYQGLGNLLYMDVGGGSTELSLVCDGKLKASRSINIGTIRLLKEAVTSQQWKEMTDQVKEITQGVENIHIVGSGGNINKLVQLASSKEKKKKDLPVSVLNNLYKKLSELKIEERMNQFDLNESRADVIVPAAQIFLTVAELTDTHTIIVPNVGLADGMINRMIEKLNLC